MIGSRDWKEELNNHEKRLPPVKGLAY